MNGTPDRCTRDLVSSRLKLVDELVFAPQAHGMITHYHIEHPSRGKFYRVGYPEYVFLSLLDGQRTVAQALTVTARTLGAKAPSQARGTQVVNWLIEHRLAHFADGDSAWMSSPSERGQTSSSLIGRMNPFWCKVPLGSPDRMLARLLPMTGWMFSFWGILAAVCLILVGLGCISSHWGLFRASAATVFSPHNWIWMILTWGVLKVIHELAHGLACKHYRGEVRETGIIFMLLAPLAYVDVTSCWRFPSRWQRIHVAAAGMLAELVIASIAAIAWVSIDSALARHLLFNVIAMASLTTLLFNANPLMRFDGYYILSDLIGIPNLSTDANRFFRSTVRKWFFGEGECLPEALGLRRWLIRGYGFAAAIWRVLICVSLLTAASVLFHGAGLILGLFGVVSWFGKPIWKICVDLQRRFHENRPSFIRAMVAGSSSTSLVAAVLLWVPWPGTISAPVAVEYAGQSIVRSGVSGIVDQVLVDDGDWVKRGQVLLHLHNDEVSARKQELELSVQQEAARQRLALKQRDGAMAQIAAQNLHSIRERLSEATTQYDHLTVKAPVDGRIVARNLSQSLGAYVSEGDEVLTVADESQKELIVSVGQDVIDSVLPQVGTKSRFRLSGGVSRIGKFDRLDPRASSDLPHPAMSATVGGSLTVVEDEGGDSSSMRLAEPRFRGVITIPASVSLHLAAGEQGHAVFGPRRERIGEFVWVRLHQWGESLLRGTIQ